jgi:glycosyltransferase involved in cell wall biosynthesis
MFRKASRILADDGPSVLALRAGRYARRHLSRVAELDLPVSIEDVLAAGAGAHDTSAPAAGPRRRAGTGPMTINWVIAPLGKGSGGHHTIMRFVRYLESRGHTCNLILYDGRSIQTEHEARVLAERHFPPMQARIYGVDEIARADVLIATAWQTAYPVFNARTVAAKFYFVQDYEPLFYPVGTLNTLAENTYRLGIPGITAGSWLAGKLEADFGMPCEHFDFGSDAGRYRFENADPRKKVVFYARPQTPRRGFELGVLALTEFVRRNPDYEINLLGSVIDYRLPFPFVSHGVLSAEELGTLYNEAAAGLVISLTNMSLLPLELLAAGCIPVVTDGENNRAVSDSPYIRYADTSPYALAQALHEVVHRPDLVGYAEQAAASVASLSWETAGEKVEKMLIRALGDESLSEGPAPAQADPVAIGS